MESVLNQLVYFGFLQGLFLLCIYAFSSKSRVNSNGYLTFLIIVLLIGLSGRILNTTEVFGVNRRFIAISEFANLLFGTTVFLFVRSSLQNRSFVWKDLVHYIPALVYSTFIVFMFITPSDESIRDRYKYGGLFVHVATFIGFALLFNVGYWVASYRMFIKFKQQLNNEISYVVNTQFLRNFLWAIGFCLFAWITFYAISFFGFDLIEREARNFIWTSISLIILFVAYYTLRESELTKVKKLIVEKKYSQSRLSNEDLNRLKEQLDKLMAEKKPYLNRNLMKADLAEMLGVNNPEIARLLNENIGMNFFEYVNYHRIREFLELAKTDKAKTLTFFGLAQEAGFNSKTTFNKSFKKIMGSSPRDYFSHNLS